MPERYKGMGYWEIITRQMSIVTRSQQSRFKDGKIAVIGCGGIGGSVIEMLARMGVGEIIAIDKDYFDLSNLNRQLLSSLDVLRKDKAKVAEEKTRLINPYVNVKGVVGEITEDNVSDILKDADIIIDALDNIKTRIIVSRYAKNSNKTFIHGAIHGTLGQVSVFSPEGVGYEELFDLPSKGKDLTDDVIEEVNKLTHGVPPVIGPTPNIVGSLEAFEAFKIITGVGKVSYAPKLLTFDLLDLSSFDLIEL